MRLSRKIAICIMLLMLSIENIYLLNHKVVGLDIVDIGILVSFLFFIYSSKKTRTLNLKFSWYAAFMVAFCVFSILISFWKGYDARYILADARNFIFMVLVYGLFKNSKTDVLYVLGIMPIFGLVNSLVFLLTSNFFVGAYAREIYTPLWISVFSIACVLFANSKLKNPLWYLIVGVNVITIIISETRSYIIPLLILFAIYGISTVKNRQYLRIWVVLGVVVVSIVYLRKAGFYELFLIRMNGSFESDSTMWLRFENSINQLKGMNFFDWLFGRGMGERFDVIQYNGTLRETSDLEMFVFNQITEWGLPIFLFNYIVYFRGAMHNHLTRQPTPLLFGALVILTGGFISGLAGMIGSIILGILFGMLSNRQPCHQKL